jgi:hypothetical protein
MTSTLREVETERYLITSSAVHVTRRTYQGRIKHGLREIQWYFGIRPLWNKSNLVYVLFGREKFCLVYDLCLEYDSRARTCMSQNES